MSPSRRLLYEKVTKKTEQKPFEVFHLQDWITRNFFFSNFDRIPSVVRESEKSFSYPTGSGSECNSFLIISKLFINNVFSYLFTYTFCKKGNQNDTVIFGIFGSDFLHSKLFYLKPLLFLHKYLIKQKLYSGTYIPRLCHLKMSLRYLRFYP